MTNNTGRMSSLSGKNKQADLVRDVNQERDRSLRRSIGVIHEVDPLQRGVLEITAFVPSEAGARHLFGEGKIPIVITDSPTDILLRFGEVRPGMVVEIFYRGISEFGQATCHIIGKDSEEARRANLLPDDKVDTAAALPFEPFGLL